MIKRLDRERDSISPAIEIPCPPFAILGINQADVSRLRKGEFQRFSAERLLTFLHWLDRNVNGCITAIGNTAKH